MFWVGSQETQASKLVNGSILEQTQLGISNASAWNDLHIHLDTLARIAHLLVRLRFIKLLFLRWREQAQFTHDPEQALRAAGVTPLPQPMPQLYQSQVRITAAHIPNQFQLCLCMLIGVTVRPPRLTGQRFSRSVPACLPEVDI